jgi:hypothetical protein
VGALSLPVKVMRPAEATLPWRRQELAFELEANPNDPGADSVR